MSTAAPSARFGSNGKATASGDDSFANANGGDYNVATASGDSSEALAVTGNDNTAIASGFNSSATADLGENNTAITSSPNCTAHATGAGARDNCWARMSASRGRPHEATRRRWRLPRSPAV